MKKFQYSNKGYPVMVPEEIKNILEWKCGVPGEYITANSSWDYLGIDSLDVVELTMEVEKEYGISIPDLEIEKCYTLGDFVKVVEKVKGFPFISFNIFETSNLILR